MENLTEQHLRAEANEFALQESTYDEKSLYGVTDGKAIGTYLEHKFRGFLRKGYSFEEGSSAKGLDFPDISVDLKVTSVKQPQSSCPYRSARQKIYGLGYSLLVFVYEKTDNEKKKTGRLNLLHVIFVDAAQTADYQTTSGILNILNNSGNRDDLIAFMHERNLPIDEIEALRLAEELLKTPPLLGYLTISNALQWRLQYGRVIEKAGNVAGVVRVK